MYKYKPCPVCRGTGRDEWHIGCEDMAPPDCRNCQGLGELPIKQQGDTDVL